MPPCLFCEIVARDRPAAVVLDEPGVLGFLDARPLFPGHVLVVPTEHVDTLEDLQDSDPLFAAVRRIAAAVRRAIGAEGTFVAMNNTVSQSVPHLHVHVVPRTKGDGLRGLFWPRTKYRDEQMESAAERIRAELSSTP